MLGPFAKCEPSLHCQSPDVASRTPAIAIAQAACDVHDNNDDDDNDNAWQGIAMAPWNGPNKPMLHELLLATETRPAPETDAE